MISTAEKVAMGIVGVAMVTTLVLPDRKTKDVINALTNLFRKPLATAMGTGKKV